MVSADSWPASGSLKAATLVLTEEEKQLLAVEGLSLPTDMPLTKVGSALGEHSMAVHVEISVTVARAEASEERAT